MTTLSTITTVTMTDALDSSSSSDCNPDTLAMIDAATHLMQASAGHSSTILASPLQLPKADPTSPVQPSKADPVSPASSVCIDMPGQSIEPVGSSHDDPHLLSNPKSEVSPRAGTPANSTTNASGTGHLHTVQLECARASLSGPHGHAVEGSTDNRIQHPVFYRNYPPLLPPTPAPADQHMHTEAGYKREESLNKTEGFNCNSSSLSRQLAHDRSHLHHNQSRSSSLADASTVINQIPTDSFDYTNSNIRELRSNSKSVPPISSTSALTTQATSMPIRGPTYQTHTLSSLEMHSDCPAWPTPPPQYSLSEADMMAQRMTDGWRFLCKLARSSEEPDVSVLFTNMQQVQLSMKQVLTGLAKQRPIAMSNTSLDASSRANSSIALAPIVDACAESPTTHTLPPIISQHSASQGALPQRTHQTGSYQFDKQRMDSSSGLFKVRRRSPEYHPYARTSPSSQPSLTYSQPQPRRASNGLGHMTYSSDANCFPTPSSPKRLPSIRYNPLQSANTSGTNANLSDLDKRSSSPSSIPAISSLLVSTDDAIERMNHRRGTPVGHSTQQSVGSHHPNADTPMRENGLTNRFNPAYQISGTDLANHSKQSSSICRSTFSSSPIYAPVQEYESSPNHSGPNYHANHNSNHYHLQKISESPTTTNYPQYSQNHNMHRYQRHDSAVSTTSNTSNSVQPRSIHQPHDSRLPSNLGPGGSPMPTHLYSPHQQRSLPTTTPKLKNDCPKRKIAMVKFASPSVTVPEQIEILINVVEEEPILKWVLERRSSMSSLVSGGCKTWITQCLRPILNCYYNCHNGDMSRFTKTYQTRLVAKRFKEAGGCFCNQ
ncbi:hypothetical protein QVD99_004990 [Batrachochytrium dendrobatidis]|nr:hypothetical protein QVD99_004990 [Batrachochytrium dendrobatidis]